MAWPPNSPVAVGLRSELPSFAHVPVVMGCAASAQRPGPLPDNAVDVAADRTPTGWDPSHSVFDTAAKASFMSAKLRGIIPPDEYEAALREVNRVIERRTQSETCCPPKAELCCGYVALTLSVCILLDYFIARSYRKLDACEDAVKARWEKYHGVSVRFYPGFYGGKGGATTTNTIRVFMPTRA